MPSFVPLLEAVFCVIAAVLVYRDAMELFVAWYSGVDRSPAAAWWFLVARITTIGIAALVVTAGWLVRRE